MNEFKRILREERLAKNLTQKDLANILHIDRTIISHWENGRSEPKLEYLCRLCYIFEISADELVGAKRTKGEKKEKA